MKYLVIGISVLIRKMASLMVFRKLLESLATFAILYLLESCKLKKLIIRITAYGITIYNGLQEDFGIAVSIAIMQMSRSKFSTSCNDLSFSGTCFRLDVLVLRIVSCASSCDGLCSDTGVFADRNFIHLREIPRKAKIHRYSDVTSIINLSICILEIS